MSKLSFRARALDPSKPMPIYLAEELPDLPEYSAINRAVPQMPSGMEKEEESVRNSAQSSSPNPPRLTARTEKKGRKNEAGDAILPKIERKFRPAENGTVRRAFRAQKAPNRTCRGHFAGWNRARKRLAARASLRAALFTLRTPVGA